MKREKEAERMWREREVNGNGRVMGMKKAKQRNEDVTAGYQRQTTKVIKLGWKADSDRLVGHSIGNSTNL